jgi:hypothetical protein
MPPHQEQVRDRESDNRGWQQEDVHRVPAHQSQGAEISSEGPLRAMLMVTVVAQYALWSHGRRSRQRKAHDDE